MSHSRYYIEGHCSSCASAWSQLEFNIFIKDLTNFKLLHTSGQWKISLGSMLCSPAWMLKQHSVWPIFIRPEWGSTQSTFLPRKSKWFPHCRNFFSDPPGLTGRSQQGFNGHRQMGKTAQSYHACHFSVI